MDEAFARAALYAACEKSPILKQIKINNLQVSELRELININSSFQTRYLPILVSKFIIKTALQLGVNTFKKDYPTLCDYIKPENIKIVVESDEMACLELSTTASSLKKHNIIFTVTKNIVTGALGLSLDNLEKILNEVGTAASSASPVPVERLENVASNHDDVNTFEKIEISNRKPVESDNIQIPITSPKIYSNAFSHTFVPETMTRQSVIYEADVREASDVSKTSKTKRKFDDGSSVNGAKKMKQTDDDETPLVDITDANQSESRVLDYVNDTLHYAKNHNQEENDADLDKMLPESNVYESESLLSITPSHSASQYNDDDDGGGFDTNVDTERQYERFDNDNDEDEFYDKLDNIEEMHLDDDPKSISSVELVTSKFKKTANTDNFITNVEQFLSRVSSTNDKSPTIPVTVAEFDFD